MQKRRCGKTGPELTVIGFGAMRMHGKDVAPWAKLVREAAEAGFNYFEASNRYCSYTCETKVGEGLKGLPRDAVCISTKSSVRECPTAEDARRQIEGSLKKLQVDYVDFYQMWGLTWKEFNESAAKKNGMLAGVRRAMDEGLVRHLGFTCHDKPENMISLVRTGEFESMTLPYNVLDRRNEPAIAEAGRLGVGVVVMSPLHGGILGYDSPVLRKMLGGASSRSTAEAAFRFVLSNPNVTCAISGMMNREEVEENRRTATEFTPFSEAERAAVDRALQQLRIDAEKLCTGCRYCMPCPQGVGISEVLRLANASQVYGLTDGSRRDYALFDVDWPYDTFKNATCCSECQACLEKCPQKINIPEELKKAHEILR